MRVPERVPVTLLHGFLGSADDWAHTTAALLGCGRTVACPDLPGHGTAPLPEPVTIDAWADRLVASAPAGPSDWVGYSLGGRVAMAVAARHPDRVRRLVLVSSALGIAGAAERAARFALDAARAEALVADFPGWLSAWYRQPLFAPLGEDAAALATEVARRAANDPAAMARVLVALSPGVAPDRTAWWSQWAGPTTWIAGERDTGYAVSAVANASAHAHAEARILAGQGHAVLRTAPAAVTNEVLRALDRRVVPVEQPADVDE